MANAVSGASARKSGRASSSIPGPSTSPRRTSGAPAVSARSSEGGRGDDGRGRRAASSPDRKSTRLNSSHSQISYAVFCLKKKKKPHATHNGERTEDTRQHVQ